MLSKGQRLTRSEFQAVFESGTRTGNSAFTYINKPAEEPKAAIVISKKLLPGAVDRNRFRRKLYNLIKKIGLTTTSIILVKKPALTLSKEELSQKLEELLR